METITILERQAGRCYLVGGGLCWVGLSSCAGQIALQIDALTTGGKKAFGKYLDSNANGVLCSCRVVPVNQLKKCSSIIGC
jgi:hypothetical protein